MSDHYVKAKVQLEQMKNLGQDHGDGDQELVSPPSPSVSPSTPNTPTSTDPSITTSSTIPSKYRGRSRGKLFKDNTLTHISAANAERNLNQLGYELTLNIKGTGKILEGKSEPNGNYVKSGVSKSFQETRFEDGVKTGRKRRPVTVDTSKAKTSLEALKISIKQLKWKEFPLGRRAACDIYWHGVSFHDNENIVSGQVNKFPGMVEMLRKINMSRAVRTMQDIFPEEYDFYPRSWILPDEYQQFSTQIRMVKENDSTVNPTFIVKPDGGSQGDGIYLIRDPSDLKLVSGSHAKQGVVQEYIQKPLLIDKLKFDIRLYVLIKSLEPLEIYIAKEGLTRFCTEPYQEPSQKNLSHVFMHLTNYSLNVHSENFVHSDSQNTGSKRTLSSVLYRLAAKGVDIKRVWSDIIALVIKTTIAVVPELKVYYQADIPPGKPGPTCFQILGFDILLMKNLKPVLLEVNSNPSMRIEHEQEMTPGVFEYVPSPVDEEVKVGVIRDTLRLMDPGQKKTTISQSKPGVLDVTPLDAESQEKSPEESVALPSLCLKQVYPKYAKQFNHLRLVERISSLFIRFLGVKGNMRLGPTAFRTFIRTCKLSNTNFTMASVDILYIDITRRWSGAAADVREAGMGLQAFVEAFFNLAGRRFKSLPLKEQAAAMLDLCEAQLDPQPASEDRRSLSCGRAPPRTVRSQTGYLANNTHINSPTPTRRASSQDQRLHHRLKPHPLRSNVEN
ncbi:tubulin polyglutamylase TTLL11 [Gouania willdenowi]|uniref:Tubulin tyrosine ligase-like family, member 11 n=1 Tax=Gouania willdenowi TaxID=441366 RepID=A0A8C5ENS1_GOUWI|nr:tubulin polyglutamylase TTLL11 [Gouania willdenowi]